jgi:hypothetical protein
VFTLSHAVSVLVIKVVSFALTFEWFGDGVLTACEDGKGGA